MGAGFFSAVGAGSLRGRDFDEGDRDGAPLVAIVNGPLARHLWPIEDGLGRCLWLDGAPTCLRVVGILNGVWKFSALRRDLKAIYLPMGQVRSAVPGALFIRTGSGRSFVTQARTIVQGANGDLPAAGGVLARDMVEPEFRPWRLGATVFGVFAMVALVITASGLYGMVAEAVAARRTEIGIRLALGARWTDIVRTVVGESSVGVVGGLVAGAVLVGIGGPWVRGVLFETSARDPVILTQATAVVVAMASAAAVVPVWRTVRTSPGSLLRSD